MYTQLLTRLCANYLPFYIPRPSAGARLFFLKRFEQRTFSSPGALAVAVSKTLKLIYIISMQQKPSSCHHQRERVAQRTRDQAKNGFCTHGAIGGAAGLGARKVSSNDFTPPRGCIGSAVINLSQARGGHKTDARHVGPVGRGRLYMIPSSNCSEALFCHSAFTPVSRLAARARLALSLCLHSGASSSAGCRVAYVTLSPLRWPGSSPAGIDCIGFPVVNPPGAAEWAGGLPGGAPKTRVLSK